MPSRPPTVQDDRDVSRQTQLLKNTLSKSLAKHRKTLISRYHKNNDAVWLARMKSCTTDALINFRLQPTSKKLTPARVEDMQLLATRLFAFPDVQAAWEELHSYVAQQPSRSTQQALPSSLGAKQAPTQKPEISMPTTTSSSKAVDDKSKFKSKPAVASKSVAKVHTIEDEHRPEVPRKTKETDTTATISTPLLREQRFQPITSDPPPGRLHPSWEAKQRLRRLSSASREFEGKRVLLRVTKGEIIEMVPRKERIAATLRAMGRQVRY